MFTSKNSCPGSAGDAGLDQDQRYKLNNPYWMFYNKDVFLPLAVPESGT